MFSRTARIHDLICKSTRHRNMDRMRPFENVVLTTERLELRPLREDDAEPLFAVFSDSAVMRYWSTAPWPTVDKAREVIAEDRKAMRSGEHLGLGVVLRNGPRFVGTCTLFDFVVQCRRAELGYALHRDFWGRGYMTEALSALLDFGFGEGPIMKLLPVTGCRCECC